jgi:hypothetical protein
VPAGVTSVHVVAIGAAGAAGESLPGAESTGGHGAIVSGDLSVAPAATLYVEVGGLPEETSACASKVHCVGGFNGGGSSTTGGGGGGASDIRTISRGESGTLGSRSLVAAGAGGGGDLAFRCAPPLAGGPGGDAEKPGGDGGSCRGIEPGRGGGAGKETKGGAGGSRFGEEGSVGTGGAGGARNGGAGGGGLYGGGGGGDLDFGSGPMEEGAAGGGGGGSNLIPAGGSFVGTAKAGEEGSVTISYTLPPQTCGKTTIGKVSDALVANIKRVNKCVVPVSALLTELHVYLQPTKVKGQQLIEGIIYASNKEGKPVERLGTSTQLTFKSTEAAGWYSLPFSPPVKLTAATYWIGIITGSSGKVAAEHYDAVKNAEDYNTNTYTSGPSNPFGSFKTINEEMSLYATFEEEPQKCAGVLASTLC